MNDLPVIVRPLRDTDHAFILDSWVNTMRFHAPGLHWVPGGVKRNYRRVVAPLLEHRPDLFRVLVNEADEDQIFAWACVENPTLRSQVLHFVYVKDGFRREGLASKLFRMPRHVVPCPRCDGTGDEDVDNNEECCECDGHGWAYDPLNPPAVCTHWTKSCERITGLSYKPSLFQEVLRELNSVVQRRSAEIGKPAGEVRTVSHQG